MPTIVGGLPRVLSLLLGQLHGFEGFLTLLVHDHPLDCSVAERIGPGDPSLNLDAIAPHPMRRRRHDHVLTYVDELMRLDPHGLPAPVEVADRPLRPVSPIDPSMWAECPRQIQLE